jgi:hypothetical protein
MRGEVERLRRRVQERGAERAQRRRRSQGTADVALDWGGWDGLFAMAGKELRTAGDRAIVRGNISYLGGAPCAVGYVELATTFFADGRSVGTARWSAPGLTEGESVQVRASTDPDRVPNRAEVLMTDARCAS